MVLGVNMEPHGEGRWRKITGVETSYYKNYGNYLFFYVTTVVSPPTKSFFPYSFSTRLSTPNYARVMPLPGATINNRFKLELRLRLARRSTDLVNEGFGHIKIPYYSVILGQQLGQQFAASFRYEVEILGENFSLSHSNDITRLPTPTPTSLLF